MRLPSALFALVSFPAFAAVPQLLGYQGRLLRADGSAVNGAATFQFTVFADPQVGSALWQEEQSLGLSDGYYATHLGTTGADAGAALEAAVASGDAWLELAVKADGKTTFEKLQPRQRVGSVAYALWAKNVKGGAVDATSISVNGATVISPTGQLTGSAAYTAGPGISIDAVTHEVAVGFSGCTTGQVLKWSGTTWTCVSPSPLGPAGGDLTGTYPNPTVTRLRGATIASGAPAAGQVLQYTGTQWQPTTIPYATDMVSGLAKAGSGITVGPFGTFSVPAPVPMGAGQASASTAASITNGAFEDMPNMSVNVTTGGGRLLMTFTTQAAVSQATSVLCFRFLLDGVPVTGAPLGNAMIQGPPGTTPFYQQNVSMTWLSVVLPAGGHNVKVQWVIAGGGTGVGPEGNEESDRTLTVVEIR